MNLLFFVTALIVPCVHCGAGFYQQYGDIKHLTMNIYSYSTQSEFEKFQNNLRITNEILCTYNSYRITNINILQEKQYIPFSDIIFDNNNKYGLQSFLNSSHNLNNIKYHIIVKKLDSISMYDDLSNYLLIDKFKITRRCSVTGELCNSTCNGDNNICSVSYPSNLKKKSITVCSRINSIGYKDIASNKTKLLLYRHTSNTQYLHMIDIMKSVERFNNYQKYQTDIDLFPPPIFNDYTVCQNEVRSIKVGYENKVVSLDFKNCYIFISGKDNAHFVSFDDFKRHKIDNPVINYNLFLREDEFLNGKYIIKSNDKHIPDNYTFERINDFEYIKPVYCLNTSGYIMEKTSIMNYGSYSDNCHYSIVEYYMMCAGNDIYTFQGQICNVINIREQSNNYTRYKSIYPEKYGKKYPSDFGVDIILKTLKESNYGDTIILIITNDMKIFENNIDSYIELANHKILTLQIFIYGTNIIPNKLRNLIENTYSIVNIINQDSFSYLPYISFLTDKQVVKYNKVSQIYNLDINSKIPQIYQIVTTSGMEMYDQYGNEREITKINYGNNLFLLKFITLPGRNILKFKNSQNKFAVLKDYIISDGFVKINNRTAYIYTNNNISINYTLYSDDKKKTYIGTSKSLLHKVKFGHENILSLNIDFDVVNMNTYVPLYDYFHTTENMINPLPLENIVPDIIHYIEGELIKVADYNYFRKSTLCDLHFFPYCVANVIWSLVFLIILVCIIIYAINNKENGKKYGKINVSLILLIFQALIFNIIYFILSLSTAIPQKGFTSDNWIVAGCIFVCPITIFVICTCLYSAQHETRENIYRST